MAPESSSHDSPNSRSEHPSDTMAPSHVFNDVLTSANDCPRSSSLTTTSTDTTLNDHTGSSVGLASTSLPASPENPSTGLLPVPVTTVNHRNPSQSSFFVSGDIGNSGEPEALPPEIAKADVSIAADGSFVQTTSALAARELKKSYDRILGVGAGAQGVVRSPYAITAVQDEFGSTVFRISHRTAHDTRTDDVSSSDPSTSYSIGHATGHRRKARLSVHDFLPSSMFKSTSDANPTPSTSAVALGSGSTPPTNVSIGFTSQGRRKLRKTRSNSDLQMRSTVVGTSAGGDYPGHLSPPPRSEHFSIEIRDELTAGADPFGQVLGWSAELAADTKPPARASRSSTAAEDRYDPHDTLVPTDKPDDHLTRRPSVSTSVALSKRVGEAGIAPFGDNVRYTAPVQRPAAPLSSPSPQLREMQSFESGLTAKVGDDRDGTPATPRSKSMASDKQDVAFLAAKNQARFSTAVFDVLQTYTGLPLPSALLSAPPTGATIKLTLGDSANPKDDPRFVIWGEIQPERTNVDDASISHSQSSHTDLSNSSPSPGPGVRKRSNARSPQSSSDAPQVVVNHEVVPQTVMIAATVERWIAQLTSQFDYDELLNFLLTYRTYISAVDLCHLLICRFHWTLEASTSVQDDSVKRIVVVRTFIAIRYWLLTFFREDFLPNEELRLLFASWLNTLSKDPALKQRPDVLNIVRKLKKIVRECKAAHFRQGRQGIERPSMDTNPPSNIAANDSMGSKTEGATSGDQSNNGSHKLDAEHDDSDVDLDLTSVPSARRADILTYDEARSPPILPLSPQIVSLQNRSTATPSANTILLSQPLSATILGHVKSSKPGTDTPLTQTPTSLPVQHSAISRAFVNTIGRLGRWKRVLNARSSVSPPHCGDVSAFDLELNATGDLLSVRGGVEEYLKMLNLSPPLFPNAQSTSIDVTSQSDGNDPLHPPGLVSAPITESQTENEQSGLSRPPAAQLENDEEAGDVKMESAPMRDSSSSFLTQTEVTDEYGQLISESQGPGWAPEVVSLDNYDLSDSDSSSHVARVRRLPRRLPLRRDFQFVRHSTESVSSMGIRSQSSLASSSNSLVASVNSHESSHSAGRPLAAGHFQQWQIELISDDEDEAGDAEAALRRLEGQIDLDRQREKDMKVGRWLKTATSRHHRDSVSSTHSASQLLEVEDEDRERGEELEQPDNEDVTVSMDSVRPSTLDVTSTSPAKITNIPSVTHALPSTSASTPLPSAAPTKPAGVVTERDRSGSVGSTQVSVSSSPNSRPSSSADVAHRPSMIGRPPRNPPLPAPSKFGAHHVPAAHRSFILMHRSETLAQQFAIIESELFAKIKFEELVLHQWGQSLEDVDVRDWVQFIKARARLKHTGKVSDPISSAKLSAILALRARFDLLVNFTSSEILLTHASERVMVVEKFIRIAWKAYLHNNFSTLVSLIAGLQTRWVNLAMGRHWHKLGIWEQRIFDDLRRFTSRPGEFKYLRNATSALIDARPLHVGVDGVSNAGTVSGTSATSRSKSSEARGAPPACVPFLGIYLAQLYQYERLPDFIDPTAPSEPVLIDGEKGTLSSPSHPQAFFNLQPLPRDLSLEPLINVHKQRLIAGVIKSFVAGQHLATNIPFKVDPRCHQKCLRLRSLDSEALHSIAKSIADP